MNRQTRRFAPWLLLIGLDMLLLTGCGGGGGGAGGSSLAYTGNTNVATITSGNGEGLAVAAYQNGADGASAAAVQSTGPSVPPATLVIADTVQRLTLNRIAQSRQSVRCRRPPVPAAARSWSAAMPPRPPSFLTIIATRGSPWPARSASPRHPATPQG